MDSGKPTRSAQVENAPSNFVTEQTGNCPAADGGDPEKEKRRNVEKGGELQEKPREQSEWGPKKKTVSDQEGQCIQGNRARGNSGRNCRKKRGNEYKPCTQERTQGKAGSVLRGSEGRGKRGWSRKHGADSSGLPERRSAAVNS